MESWTIIILGATGDLARTRLIPALYALLRHKPRLSFVFIGAAKDVTTVEQLIHDCLPQGNSDIILELIDRSSYVTVDFTNKEDFNLLARHIKAVEAEHKLSGNRLVYLSTASVWYCTLTQGLVAAGIIENQKKLSGVSHRIVYEKPFGSDAQSAQDINACITSLLEEDQLWRVDHYLTKSLTMSIALLRFSNIFFEPVWNAQYIDQVQLILSEKASVEGRGAFYDAYGALKDVVQNHMFELMALVGMERPHSLQPADLHASKIELLKSITVTDGLLGQYDGYRRVHGVDPHSQRETFALLRCLIKNPRWQNIPFYLKTGKALAYKSTEIHLVFKPQSKSIIDQPGTFKPNRLIITISPDSGFVLSMNTRVGLEHKTEVITMDFCYRCSFGLETPHSYERLFLELFADDKTIAVSPQEIQSAWHLIDEVERLKLPLYSYKPLSYGPNEVDAFTQKYGILWQEK